MVTVLYVDDERDLLELCKIFLEQSPDFSVWTAASADEALAMLKTRQCDVIISDYQMPDIDGIAFLKLVREQYGNIPFILFTGRGREEIVIEAINNGADFYLQKGGDVKAQFAELAHKIRQATARRQAETSLIESEKRLADIINFLPDATFAINQAGVIIAWNRAIEEMTGLSAESMLGKGDHEYALPFYGERRPILIDLIFAPDAEVNPYYSNIIRKDNTITAETGLTHPKGSRMTVLAKASPLYNRQGELVGAIEAIRDITERKKADDELRAAYEQISASEEELREQLEILATNEHQVRENASRLEYMLGFFERANSSEKDFMSYAIEGAGIVTGSPLGYLAFLNEDESELSMYAWSTSAMKECAIRDKPIIYKTEKTGLWGEAVRQKRPVITNDYSAPNPAKKGYPAGHPVITRHMNIPVIDEGHVVMVAGVANKPHDYTEDDVRQLSLLMQGLWQVISQRNTKKDLLDSEERYRSILENIQDVYYRSDAEGNLIMASPSVLALLGYGSLDEVLGKNIARDIWVFPERRAEFADNVKKNGSVKNYEVVLWRKDDRLITVETSSHSYSNKDGSLGGIEGIFHDVTVIRVADQQVQLLAGLMDITPASITVHDEEGNFLYANQRTFELHGYSKEEFMATNLHQLDVPVSEEMITARIEVLRKNGESTFDVEHIRKDGSRLPLHVTITAIRWNSGDAILSVATDISERKRAEKTLHEVETLYRSLVENSHDIIYTLKPDGTMTFVSPSWTSNLGHGPEEVVGRSFRDFVVPDDIVTCEDLLKRTLISRGVQPGIEFRALHCDRSVHWYRTTLMPVLDDNNAVVMLVGNAIDFTDYRQAEESLRESEARYRSVIENIQDAFVRSDQDGILVMVSPSAATLFGYDTPGDILGKPIASFYTRPEIRPVLIEKMAREGELVDQTIEFQRRDGTTFWGSVNAHFVYNENGEADGIECSVHDVTVYRTMERAVREANHKLSLLNSITRHDVANQLTILQGFAQIAAQKKGDPVIADYLAKILAAADTISRQIEFTRTYQDLGVQDPSWTSVEAVIDHVQSRVPVRFSKTCGNVEIFSDPMLERVFFNLFDNAARHGGDLTEITVRCEREPDGLLLIVEDDGNGIPLSEKEKIFQRGFGKNSGLGLFLVREILSITGITIKETGIPGKGARFEMLVPKDSFRQTGAKAR